MGTVRSSNFVGGVIVAATLTFVAVVQSAAQTPPTARPDATANEIVVTAQRSGIPVWRVVGPRTTVVLVGSIGRVAPGTQWDPVSLDRALAKADRVMFPESIEANVGLFSLIGVIGDWHKQATLPKGQTLQSMTTPEQWARLVALRNRGVLKPGFEREHPYHLAMMLNGLVRNKQKLIPGADSYVRRYIHNNKSKQVAAVKIDFKDITGEFFGSAPRAHIACLMNNVALVEAGAVGVQARANARVVRSQAWAARRVSDALAAKTDNEQQACWPRGSRFEKAREASLKPTIRSLMNVPKVTLAVVSLDSLAERGGGLDDLVSAGFDVRGPRWQN